MKSSLIFLLALVSASVANGWCTGPWCYGYDQFALVGFGKDNPIGETTGGAGGRKVNVTTPKELAAEVAGDEPKTIVLMGDFALPSRIKVGSNKSLIGHGKGASITGNGINVQGVTNVIIRNLKISYILGNDAITIRNSTRSWIDHNEFESEMDNGPDRYDGQVDIVQASDWITVSWNYFHDHWKANLIGNGDNLRDVDFGHLHVTLHHNYYRHEGTRGPAGRFGHQHIYNNLYEDYLYQAIHSRSDNQMLVEGNVFRGDTREALSTYGLVIPDDSPNTSPDGDFEIDGFVNLGARNDWGPASINITQVGNFTSVPYKYKITPLRDVERAVKRGAGLGKI